jgi:glycerate dehydrogenase
MKKNMIVLDGFTLSPLEIGQSSVSHPSWDALAALGTLQIFPRTQPDQVVERGKGAEILLTNKARISAEAIAQLPDLKYIGVMATGTNVVDVAAARARGIVVTNVPGYSTASVAQIVFSLLFELSGQVGATAREVRDGRWAACEDFSFTLSPFIELSGKTFGIMGYGAIGAAVAKIADALGMRVLVHSRSEKPGEVPVEWVTLEKLLKASDVLSLHCPLTPQTEKMINAESLATMKPTAFLINTGRGPLIDEAAVADALDAGRLGGFGGDVLSTEPPSPSNPLLQAPRTVITPHIAWASVEARGRLMVKIVENLEAYLSGQPQNVVV